MHVYIGADHRGYELAKALCDSLQSEGVLAKTVMKEERDIEDDYVDSAVLVARQVMTEREKGEQTYGIVLCGSGAGVTISANKIRGVRCCLGFTVEQVRAARSDDDVNILALPADYITIDEANGIVSTFLQTSFVPSEKHLRRIEKIKKLEEHV